MSPRKPVKFEKIVVGAMKKLQDIQGSSAKEIIDFLAHEYDFPVSGIRKHVRLALKRGVSYGILQQKNGMYTCNREIFCERGQLGKKGEAVEPCPWMKNRGRRKSQRKKKEGRRPKSSKRRGRRGGRKSKARRGSKKKKPKSRK